MTTKADVILAAIEYGKACFFHGLYAEEDAVKREKAEDEFYEKFKQKLDEFEQSLTKESK